MKSEIISSYLVLFLWLFDVWGKSLCAAFVVTRHGSHCVASSRSLVRIPTSATTAKATVSFGGIPSVFTAKEVEEDEGPLPFLIEPIPDQPTDKVYAEISDMCIDAFFNDGDPNRAIPFWKQFQLSYLRKLQQTDLRRRRKVSADSNMMFIARRVVPASLESARDTPLLLDLSKVQNLAASDLRGDNDYVRGEVLGFVEVTLRPYGLGTERVGFDEESKIQLRKSSFYTKRPILTNLSVKYTARRSGVGGRLLEQCEQEVAGRWSSKEIILEVETDNANALTFYDKRGYKVLFEDPTSRRYDTNGFFLRQLRCRRKVMRKALTGLEGIDTMVERVTPGSMWNVLGRLRKSLLPSVANQP